MLRINTRLCQLIFKNNSLTENADVPSQNQFLHNQYDRALHMHGYIFLCVEKCDNRRHLVDLRRK